MMSFKRLFLTATLLIFVLSSATLQVLAEQESTFSTQVPEIKYEQINPDLGSKYILKRLREKIRGIFSFSASSKEKFYRELANRRLAELKYVVEKKDLNHHEVASKRYFTTVGQLTEYILSNKSLERRKEEVANLLSSHLLVVEDLQKYFRDTTAEWRFIKHDADYLRIYIGKLQGK